jgi:hypothetical protein
MIIAQPDTVFQPITITLETQQEAEKMMAIMGLIAGCSEKTPRGLADKIYYELGGYGIDYRDDAFNSKYPSRGTLIFQTPA